MLAWAKRQFASHTGVPTYEGIEYRDVYEGITQKFTGNDDSLERIFIVEPGADPRQIEIEYSGVEEILLLEDGTLVLETALGELTESAPVGYQEIDGQRHYVEADFQILESGNVGFSLGEYDPDYELIVDPILEYSTFLGGGSNDVGYGIAVDSTGATYITGQTRSDDFPVIALQESRSGSFDAFVTKLDPEGNSVVYSTFYGCATLRDRWGRPGQGKCDRGRHFRRSLHYRRNGVGELPD
ncbi:MAG: SBBP repeat-containing protein [Hormoscilla sp. GM7CHS1pb]|nr:SBBP repeat-containing protein [Hormoscilla sp. GM7CHS1pb]